MNGDSPTTLVFVMVASIFGIALLLVLLGNPTTQGLTGTVPLYTSGLVTIKTVHILSFILVALIGCVIAFVVLRKKGLIPDLER